MIKTFTDLFKNKDIRGKIFFTLAMLFIYRLGSAIPVPGVDATLISASIQDNSILNMMNLLGGGSFQDMSIFAMGVGPYITSSIIIQLLSMDVVPALTEMAKSGQQGRQKMDKITRYLTVILCMIQAFSLVYTFDHQSTPILMNSSIASYLYVATVLTAGTMFLLWIGDRISTKGIGNGVSILIFAGIVSSIPFQFMQVYSVLVDSSSSTAMTSGLISFALYLAMYIVIIVLVIFMQKAERKIPIQYTSSAQSTGNKNMTFLPLKINSASVIPVIFASAIITAPQMVLTFFPNNQIFTTISSILSTGTVLGLCIYGTLIVLFTFFYTNMQIDPSKIAENLGKSGTYIPGIRPGSETREYVGKVLNRITVLGASFLLVIALIPYVLPLVTNLPSSVSLGGTGIIIVVGVAMETTSQLKGQLTQKQYRGFIGK
ncbi:MAG: preprotein translocase subunit SecY [Erysipelotrichaceae bacterium]